MARVLSEAGETMLEDLPHFMRSDPIVQGYVDTMAREMVRVEELIEEARTQWFASNADQDEYLSIWEYNLGLPIRTPGLTVDQRRVLVSSALRKRSAASGADWVATLNGAFGTGTWSYKEDNANYQVRITIPYGSGTLSALGVLSLARQVTPAHLDITVTYDGGGGGGTFIVGISLIGIGQL